jgi:hypothetical protein
MRIFLVLVVSLLAKGLTAVAATSRRNVSAIDPFGQLGLDNLANVIQQFNISLSGPIDKSNSSGSFLECPILVCGQKQFPNSKIKSHI